MPLQLLKWGGIIVAGTMSFVTLQNKVDYINQNLGTIQKDVQELRDRQYNSSTERSLILYKLEQLEVKVSQRR